MAALADRFQVVAIDQRGYNLSDKPKGVENYDMPPCWSATLPPSSVTSAATAPRSSDTTGAAWWRGASR